MSTDATGAAPPGGSAVSPLPRYRHKPEVIEAIQVTEENLDVIRTLPDMSVRKISLEMGGAKTSMNIVYVRIGMDVYMPCYPTDWIVWKNGKVSRCKDAVFRENYEPLPGLDDAVASFTALAGRVPSDSERLKIEKVLASGGGGVVMIEASDA